MDLFTAPYATMHQITHNFAKPELGTFGVRAYREGCMFELAALRVGFEDRCVWVQLSDDEEEFVSVLTRSQAKALKLPVSFS